MKEHPFTKDVKLPYTTGEIKIYFLEAPLGVFGKVVTRALNSKDLVDINANHTGIGLVYENNVEYAIDYLATSGITHVFLPTISKGGDLTWRNQTSFTYYEDINRDYWVHSTYAGTITYNQLINIFNWIFNDFAVHNYMYVTPTVVYNVQDYFNPAYRNSICDTFSLAFIKYAGSIGGKIEYVTPFHEDAAAIISQNIMVLDVNSHKDKMFILEYYTILEKFISMIMKLVKPKMEEHLADRKSVV